MEDSLNRHLSEEDRRDIEGWAKRPACPYCRKIISFREPEHAKQCV